VVTADESCLEMTTLTNPLAVDEEPARSSSMRRTWVLDNDDGDALAGNASPTFEVEKGHVPGASQKEGLERLPIKGLLAFSVPFYVAGPSCTGTSQYSHYVCMAETLLGLTSVNYVLASLLSRLPNMEGVFYETMLGWFAANCFVLLAQHKTWSAINSFERLAPSVIPRLLSTEVLTKTADQVTQWKMDTPKNQQRKLGFFTGYFVVLFLLAIVSASHLTTQNLNATELVTIAIAVATSPVYIAATGMPWLLSPVLFTAAADQVRQITLQLTESSIESVNFDECIRSIHRVDADITQLAKYARWLCLQTIIGNACAALPWAVVGLGPQPPADHWWSGNNPIGLNFSYACCVNSVLFVLFGISTAAYAASITSCCDELRDSVNRLRASPQLEQQRPSDVMTRDVTMATGIHAIRIATPEELAKIDNLLSYIDGMNQGSGMGFCLPVSLHLPLLPKIELKKKISYALVANTAVSAVSVMGVLFTTLLHSIEPGAEEMGGSASN
jgi:hypothetical protein